jgi:hypothetical protein
MLEKNGVGIAAVSYDSQEILRGFADRYMASDFRCSPITIAP